MNGRIRCIHIQRKGESDDNLWWEELDMITDPWLIITRGWEDISPNVHHD